MLSTPHLTPRQVALRADLNALVREGGDAAAFARPLLARLLRQDRDEAEQKRAAEAAGSRTPEEAAS